MATQTDRGVPLSTLCPKFLHTNSTSHTWPFSAIAELIDNAYDPDVSAKHFWIDKTVVNQLKCLSFMDDGNGLNYQTMHKMLSFGYSDKVASKGIQPIGIYGNGFKSGSMRLGKDAIVFSKSKCAQCIGMLSQTYLEEIGAKQISVPIVCFEPKENTISVKDEHKASLQDILRYSPFKTEKELLTEISAIGPSWSQSKTGTRIIIWNLRRTLEDKLEFDFDADRYDIRIPSDAYMEMNDISYIPESLFSLRAYCSILYLKPRLQIMIRGKKVKSELIAKSLAHSRKDHYKPTFFNKRVPIIFGYNPKSKDQYGIMMYHKNRLIKAYERVGCQLKANNKGVRVIGVIECNFLDPTHNKQGFEENDKYRKTMTSLGIKLEEYWNEIRFSRSREDPTGIPVEDTIKQPDQNWAQCDDCSQWRKLPDGIDCTKLPEKWYCYMNPDPQFRSCQVEQEPEDSDDEQPSYRKTYKQEERKRLERKRQQTERERMANVLQNEVCAMQLQKNTVSSPSTPTTPRSRINTNPVQGGSPLTPSSISQGACSPSSSNGLPVISNVCSLASILSRGKRPQPQTPESTPKRPRVDQMRKNISNQLSSLDVRPQNSPSIPIVDDETEDEETEDEETEDDETDDDLVIVEGASTPKPKSPLALPRIKTEQVDDCDVNMLLECSDDAAVDDPPETAGSSTSAVPPEVANITTQTELPKIMVKEEKTDEKRLKQGQNEEEHRASSKSVGPDTCERSMKEENLSQPVCNGAISNQDSNDNINPSSANVAGRQSPSLLCPNMPEMQKQQDQVPKLMQERDSLKEQVNQLLSQLQEMQRRVDVPQVSVKKEHEGDDTGETPDTMDYKILFENAKQKIKELIKDKEALLASAAAKPSTDQGDDKGIDEIALQVDYLMRELDESHKEKERLQAQLKSLEEEKANLASECESLRLSLQQIKESTAACKASDSSVQTEAQETTTTADCGPSSSTNASRCLIELRHNVGRLLVSSVPALELDQVNYECSVIDEILEQYLNNEVDKSQPSLTS